MSIRIGASKNIGHGVRIGASKSVGGKGGSGCSTGIIAIIVIIGLIIGFGGNKDKDKVDEPKQNTVAAEAQQEAQAPEKLHDPEPEVQQPEQEPQPETEVQQLQPVIEQEPEQPVERQQPEQTPQQSAPEKENHPKETDGVTVYVTPSGTKYHLDPDCGGENSAPTTLEKATQSGKTPCKKCAQ